MGSDAINHKTSSLSSSHADSFLRELELRNALAHVLANRDEERRHVAEELREDIAQRLVGSLLKLATLQSRVQEPDVMSLRLFGEISELVQDAVNRIRRTSYALYPPLFDELGLAFVLRWYIGRISASRDFGVELEIETGPARLSRTIELTAFHIIEEFTSFASANLKHAEINLRVADKAEIRMSYNAMQASRPSIEAPNPSERSLVAAIRERVEDIGGQLKISSEKSRTSLKVFLPTQRL